MVKKPYLKPEVKAQQMLGLLEKQQSRLEQALAEKLKQQKPQ